MQKFLYHAVHAEVGGASQLVYSDSAYLPSESVTCLHYHHRCEIGLCLSGNGIWVTDSQSYAVSPGNIIVNFAGIPHYSRSITTANSPRCQCTFFYFDPQRLLAAAGIQPNLCLTDQAVRAPVVLTRHTHGKLWYLLEQMMLTVQTCADRAQGERMAAHWYALFLLELNNHAYPQENPPEISNEQLLPAFRKIMVHFSNDLTLKELADSCSLSACYFSTEFRKAFGCPPIRYLNQFRVSIAAQLLAESDIGITAICNFVGFAAPSELYRHFISIYGMSPTEYRSRRNGVQTISDKNRPKA